MHHQTIGLTLIVVFVLLGIVTFPWIKRYGRNHQDNNSKSTEMRKSEEE